MDRYCKHCGKPVYQFNLTADRTILRSLVRDDLDPLVCAVIDANDDDNYLTLQHEEA